MPAPATTAAPLKRQLWQTHPRYDEWAPTWRLLANAVEGDGGFLDGSHLVAHPRELNYKRDAEGRVDFTTVVSETEKFKRRKALARYDHLAGLIVDSFVAYQYAKPIRRVIDNDAATSAPALSAWWENVDGEGTHITDWMRESQALANTFGFLWVLLDRATATEPATQDTRATEPPLVLRRYTPLDALDWIAPGGKLQAVKFLEADERTSLLDTAAPRGTLLLWDAEAWTRIDAEGRLVSSGPHGYGEVPVAIHYARRRPRVPIIGRSLLGDGRLFRELYNLVSELRELMRTQTFSVLNIVLPEDKSPGDGRALLGEQLSVESILWTWGQPAGFISPSSGPVADYMQEILNITRLAFRQVGLPWDSDSRDAESADSRRLKAMDLNRLLRLHALEAEACEYQLARLWHIGTYGRARGLQLWDDLKLTIAYPEEFHTEDAWSVINNTREARTLRLGPTADAELAKRAVPIVLPDLPTATADQIAAEIEEEVQRARTMREAALSSPIFGGGPKAEDDEEGDDQPPASAGRHESPAPPATPVPPEAP